MFYLPKCYSAARSNPIDTQRLGLHFLFLMLVFRQTCLFSKSTTSYLNNQAQRDCVQSPGDATSTVQAPRGSGVNMGPTW